MLETLSPIRCAIISTTMAIVVAGCASTAPVPVESRTPSSVAAPTDAATPVARPGYYIVKKGDTLYSIAHQYERDYREIAAWNNIGDPNVIKVGQELRVAVVPPPSDSGSAPATGTTVVAIPTTVAIESTPQNGAASSAAPTPPVDSVPAAPVAAPVGQKTEPKGGRIPYSEQAWKDLQNRDKPGAAPVPPASSAKPAVQSPAAEPRGADSKPAGADDIDWIWPGSGKVLATFNDSSNKGVDISGNIGDPVVAAGSGKIVYVGSGLRGYGNLVIIKHNNNFLSAYAHNKEVLVKEGQSVQKGQKIATLGNSDTDRPVLHFEIRLQGKPVDPMKYLPSR